MKRKRQENNKSQNDIDKDTGGDVRKNNRIIDINTQCPKEKSISPERHSSARETDQQTTACWKEVTHSQKNQSKPKQDGPPRPPGPLSRPKCQTSQSPPPSENCLTQHIRQDNSPNDKTQTILLQPRQSPSHGAHNPANLEISPDKASTDLQVESPPNKPQTVNPSHTPPSPTPKSPQPLSGTPRILMRELINSH